MTTGKIVQLTDGWRGYIWNNFLSHCPFLGQFKGLYLNEVVKAKKNILKNPLFGLCCLYEAYILSPIEDFLEAISPTLVPNFLSRLCSNMF